MRKSLCKWPTLVMCSSVSQGQLVAGLKGVDTELNCSASQSKGQWPRSPRGCRRGESMEREYGCVAGSQAQEPGNR